MTLVVRWVGTLSGRVILAYPFTESLSFSMLKLPSLYDVSGPTAGLDPCADDADDATAGALAQEEGPEGGRGQHGSDARAIVLAPGHAPWRARVAEGGLSIQPAAKKRKPLRVQLERRPAAANRIRAGSVAPPHKRWPLTPTA